MGQKNDSMNGIKFLFFFSLLTVCACRDTTPIEDNRVIYTGDIEVPMPNPNDWKQFDHHFVRNTAYVNDFGLAKLPTSFYDNPTKKLKATLAASSKMISNEELEVHFFPLNQDTTGFFQYTHEYFCESNDLNPDTNKHKKAAYPSLCLGANELAKARVVLENKTPKSKEFKCRLFYQNNSYNYTTSLDADFVNQPYLANYYGGSTLHTVTVDANSTKEFFVEYRIGITPKMQAIPKYNFYGCASPGNYEFMLWLTEEADTMVQDTIDYTTINPFAYYSQQIKAGNNTLENKVAYVHPKHFKFVNLVETFADNKRNYAHGDIYLYGNRDNKKLCDTCSGYFKDTITDNWKHDDYFEGFIAKADWIKADYGNRIENVRIDNSGIYLVSPKSTPAKKQKTWGEIKFAPAFLYGTVKIVAKFSQLRNPSKTPTGIVHNLWLYQHNPGTAPPIAGHPYQTLTNNRGQQPYEIDIEIWSKIYDENWGGGSSINYSIVDYMRNAGALVKPGEKKDIDGKKVDRHNNVQLNYPHQGLLRRKFFEQYHLYEIQWSPDEVLYKIDGKPMAKIDRSLAAIPDVYSFLWIGSPIYQDGTYYAQKSIPFLPYDAVTHIRYISIE